MENKHFCGPLARGLTTRRQARGPLDPLRCVDPPCVPSETREVTSRRLDRFRPNGGISSRMELPRILGLGRFTDTLDHPP